MKMIKGRGGKPPRLFSRAGNWVLLVVVSFCEAQDQACDNVHPEDMLKARVPGEKFKQAEWLDFFREHFQPGYDELVAEHRGARAERFKLEIAYSVYPFDKKPRL